MATYCIVGDVAGAPYVRYGIVERGMIVSVQVSVPDGECVPNPMKYARKGPAEVQIKQFRINEVPAPGEQPRRTTWRRSGRTAAKLEAQ